MNTISATKTSSLHLSLDVQIPPHINTSYLPPNAEIQNAFNIFLRDNPQILEQVLKKFQPKGKWAKVMKRIEEKAMGKAAGIEMEKAREEFRETFAIGDNIGS